MKLIMEQWRRFVEDQEQRQAFAKDLKSSGRSKANLVSDRGPKTKNFRDEMFKQVLSQGRDLKKAFAKTADREFLDSLVTVHWTDISGVEKMLRGPQPERRTKCCRLSSRSRCSRGRRGNGSLWNSNQRMDYAACE